MGKDTHLNNCFIDSAHDIPIRWRREIAQYYLQWAFTLKVFSMTSSISYSDRLAINSFPFYRSTTAAFWLPTSNLSHYWELLGIKRGRNFVKTKYLAHESVDSSLPCSNCAANYIDREPAHLFLDKTIWRLEKGTKV
ncbi:hypothetical protein NQ315_008319 [Exocentrus adspersus]|uniref:Uncharacterized protein n=1 Tax=Exocentrus adspersus TaxID=1586481 RepID=A0AAV8VDJ6_9CUCU|nr:hypothetical protein NQ315_008319 [Exocentrus adspersus]